MNDKKLKKQIKFCEKMLKKELPEPVRLFYRTKRIELSGQLNEATVEAWAQDVVFSESE